MGIETLFLGAMVAGTAMSAYGKMQEGKAAEEAGLYKATVLRQRAASERDSANAEAGDYERKQSYGLASSRAARAGTGVTFEGSPMLVDSATVREIALGAERIRHGGKVRGNRFEQDAGLAEMAGENARTAGYIGAGTSILSGVSSYAGTRMRAS